MTVPPEFDTSYEPKKRDHLTIGIIGKYHPSKRILEFYRALSKMRNKNRNRLKIRVLSNSTLHKKILHSYFPDLKDYVELLKYIPPWKMPDFYASCDLIYVGEKEFPVVYHLSKIPAEAFYTGVPTILSDEIFEKYRRVLPLEKDKHTLVVNSTNYENIKICLENILEDTTSLFQLSKNTKPLKLILRDRFAQYIEHIYNIFQFFHRN